MFSRAFIALIVIAARMHAAEVPVEFAEANQRYDEGKFEDARRLYTSLVEKNTYSSDLFYNLGNTEFRLNQPGAAVLNYERALFLAPGHAEAAANLNFVRSRTGAKTEPGSWSDALFGGLPHDSFPLIAAVAGWTVIFGVAWSWCARPGFHGAAVAVSVAGLVALAYGLAGVWHLQKERSLAVIVAARAEARSAPADNATLADNLSAGSRVHVIAKRGAWSYCQLPSRQNGWISSEKLELVPISGS